MTRRTLIFKQGFSLRMVWVGWCFRDPSLHDDIRRCALSVGIRSRIARLAGLYGGSCTPNAVPSLRVSRATPPPPIPQLRLVQGGAARRGGGFECGLMERVARREGSQRV